MSATLKPCPFCRGEAIKCGGNKHNYRFWVMCSNCHACPHGDVPDLDEAIDAWNRRADGWHPEVTDAMIEAGLANYGEGGCMGLDSHERREVVKAIIEAAFAAEAS